MEQTLPLSEMSTMPTRKLRVMRWVTFVMALICVIGAQSIAIISNSIEVVETQILVQNCAFFCSAICSDSVLVVSYISFL